MKYKLINKKTNKETICDKVTIDGYDYYIQNESSEECFYYNMFFNQHLNQLLHKNNLHHENMESKEVFATNNPISKSPQIINKVEKLAIEYNQKRFVSGFNPSKDVFASGILSGWKQSHETYSFSEEDMIEFTEWAAISHYHYYYNGTIWSWGNAHTQHYCSTKELLEIWKKHNLETIWYE